MNDRRGRVAEDRIIAAKKQRAHEALFQRDRDRDNPVHAGQYANEAPAFNGSPDR